MSSASGSPSEEVQVKRKAPRLYHTKSRNGCQRCRDRRVKCNETRPRCGNCSRHGVACVYNTPQTSARQPSPPPCIPEQKTPKQDLMADYRPTRFIPPPVDSPVQSLLSNMDSDDESYEISEGKSRRILELWLQQNFIEKTSKTMSGAHNSCVVEAWSIEVPKLALYNDNVLYGMFTLSAIHLLKSEPNNQDLRLAREAYERLAFREHRRAVARLSSETADAVCYGSTIILNIAFASLQHRPLNPWVPPVEWIRLARGSGIVFGTAFDQINNFSTAKIKPLTEGEPPLRSTSTLFAEEFRIGLEYLLRQDLGNEIWDEETQYAYERAVSYIGGVQRAIHAGEHRLGICRRVMAFAMLGPKLFYTFVEECRPRALVILAHYFAFFSKMADIWWIGNVARREIQGIQRVLPVEWHDLLRNPVATVEPS